MHTRGYRLLSSCWFAGWLAMLSWGGGFFLVGCVSVGPVYQPPGPELPVSWSGARAETTNPTGNEVLSHWWTLFNDPLLNSLIKRAVAANLDMKIAEARIQQARAQYRLTTAAIAPTVGGSGNYASNRKSENAGTSGGGTPQGLFQAGFDAGWELDIFGGARRGAEAAEARLTAAGENSRDILVSLAAEVARNYLELRGGQQRLAAARKNFEVQEKTLTLTKGRRASGLGNELEVVQAETQLALTGAQLPPLEISIGQSSFRLALLLGLSPQALIEELTVPSGLPMLPPHLPETLPSDLLRRRPDIRRAERQLAAASADIGVATAELFPHFSLIGLIGLQSLHLSDLLSASSRYWTTGSTVRWSLFNGGRVRANIDLNQARREEAQSTYEKTVLTALNEVETALLTLTREENTHIILLEAVASGQRAVELATGRYQAGLSGVLDVLLSERALYQSQDQLIQSEQRLGIVLVALCKALGGGWEVSTDLPEPLNGPEVEAIAPLQPTPLGDVKK